MLFPPWCDTYGIAACKGADFGNLETCAGHFFAFPLLTRYYYWLKPFLLLQQSAPISVKENDY